MKINNLSPYAKGKKCIIVTEVFPKDGGVEWWYYGAYDDLNYANELAMELGGETGDKIVLEDWEGK